MKSAIFVFAVSIALFTHSAFALTDEDRVALKQLTREYASWDFSGHPVEFRERLDYQSFEEQRQILLKLAGIQWNGFWGDYWRKRGVTDLKTLRSFSPKEFWLRYHSELKPASRALGRSGAGLIPVDVHAITEARGLAYVIYQVAYPGSNTPRDDRFRVLRARWTDGEWRLVAFPRITAILRRQLAQFQPRDDHARQTTSTRR